MGRPIDTHPKMVWADDKKSYICPDCGLTIFQAMKESCQSDRRVEQESNPNGPA